MKTITFYSYKGGVGRSLALSNIAIRLSEFKKKVCVIDFDLEAPGLHFKFKNSSKKINIDKGLVDYIYHFSCYKKIPGSIGEYITTINPRSTALEPISLIPAGDTDNPEYWKKLASINWAEMFYSDSGYGINFFLDLKAKIEKEINPDFLLIDSRTGITDISGVTLKLLADEVVILAANNEENIDGSKKIIKSLIDPTNSLFGASPKVNFLLTRLPYTNEPVDRRKEYNVVERMRNEFSSYLEIEKFDITVIHSERRIEENERQVIIGYEYDNDTISISNDYLKLFDILTSDVLTGQEITEFQNKKYSEREYAKALNERDNSIRIDHLTKAIEFNPNKFEYYIERGRVYLNIGEYEKSIIDLERALELNPDSPHAYNLFAIVNYRQNKFAEALKYLERGITIAPNYSGLYITKQYIYNKQKKYDLAKQQLDYILNHIDANHVEALNSRADLYREINDLKNAYSDIYKAIEIDSSNPIFFATLAEIYATEGKIEEFYLNLNIALSFGIEGSQLNSAKVVYEKFKNDTRFQMLMDKYGIDIEEVFKNNDN